MATEILERAEASMKALPADKIGELNHFIEHAKKQIDLIRRRVIKGETIPHDEKVFSRFEPHTRWISKGKAGVPQELGLPAGCR